MLPFLWGGRQGCSRLEGVGWVAGGVGGMDDDEADTGTGGGEAQAEDCWMGVDS